VAQRRLTLCGNELWIIQTVHELLQTAGYRHYIFADMYEHVASCAVFSSEYGIRTIFCQSIRRQKTKSSTPPCRQHHNAQTCTVISPSVERPSKPQFAMHILLHDQFISSCRSIQQNLPEALAILNLLTTHTSSPTSYSRMSRDVAVSSEHEDAQPVCSRHYDIVAHKVQSVQRYDTASIRNQLHSFFTSLRLPSSVYLYDSSCNAIFLKWR
jgi:hypothetical protein